jgi:hypothetical protein
VARLAADDVAVCCALHEPHLACAVFTRAVVIDWTVVADGPADRVLPDSFADRPSDRAGLTGRVIGQCLGEVVACPGHPRPDRAHRAAQQLRGRAVTTAPTAVNADLTGANLVGVDLRRHSCSAPTCLAPT